MRGVVTCAPPSASSFRFSPPQHLVRVVRRPLLLDRLDEGLRCRCTVVEAPAGYGKTVLLSQWRERLTAREIVSVWITLDRDDGGLGLLRWLRGGLFEAGLVNGSPADATIHAPPPPSPSDLKSPVTPLLTPAPARPVRRWGIAVFPENNVIRRVSSAPSSPISFDNTPVSPTSIIAIKSPEEWRDSKRISDVFSSMTPFTISFPQETDDPLAPPIRTQVPPAPIPSAPSSLSPIQKSEDLVLDIGIGISRSASKVSRTTLGKNSSLVTIEESDSPAKSEEEQPRSPQTKTDPKSPPQGTNSHRKRTPSVYRRESSVRRPDRHLMLKRDSGAPFSHRVAMVTNSSPLPSQPEGTEVKGGWKNTRRLSVSGRFLRASTMKTKTTTVTMRKGKKVEEKDVVAVIPQLRELKAPKRFRW